MSRRPEGFGGGRRIRLSFRWISIQKNIAAKSGPLNERRLICPKSREAKRRTCEPFARGTRCRAPEAQRRGAERLSGSYPTSVHIGSHGWRAGFARQIFDVLRVRPALRPEPSLPCYSEKNHLGKISMALAYTSSNEIRISLSVTGTPSSH